MTYEEITSKPLTKEKFKQLLEGYDVGDFQFDELFDILVPAALPMTEQQANDWAESRAVGRTYPDMAIADMMEMYYHLATLAKPGGEELPLEEQFANDWKKMAEINQKQNQVLTAAILSELKAVGAATISKPSPVGEIPEQARWKASQMEVRNFIGRLESEEMFVPTWLLDMLTPSPVPGDVEGFIEKLVVYIFGSVDSGFAPKVAGFIRGATFAAGAALEIPTVWNEAMYDGKITVRTEFFTRSQVEEAIRMAREKDPPMLPDSYRFSPEIIINSLTSKQQT